MAQAVRLAFTPLSVITVAVRPGFDAMAGERVVEKLAIVTISAGEREHAMPAHLIVAKRRLCNDHRSHRVSFPDHYGCCRAIRFATFAIGECHDAMAIQLPGEEPARIAPHDLAGRAPPQFALALRQTVLAPASPDHCPIGGHPGVFQTWHPLFEVAIQPGVRSRAPHGLGASIATATATATADGDGDTRLLRLSDVPPAGTPPAAAVSNAIVTT